MNVGDICNRVVIYMDAGDSIQQAAELMRKYHVGDLVITQYGDGRPVPVGIVTDRDIVVEVIAKGIDPATLTAADIMGDKLVTAKESSEVSDTLEAMRKQRVRRVPVVDDKGVLVGILAIDDVLSSVASQLKAMAGIVGGQRVQESRLRSI